MDWTGTHEDLQDLLKESGMDQWKEERGRMFGNCPACGSDFARWTITDGGFYYYCPGDSCEYRNVTLAAHAEPNRRFVDLLLAAQEANGLTPEEEEEEPARPVDDLGLQGELKEGGKLYIKPKGMNQTEWAMAIVNRGRR